MFDRREELKESTYVLLLQLYLQTKCVTLLGWRLPPPPSKGAKNAKLNANTYMVAEISTKDKTI